MDDHKLFLRTTRRAALACMAGAALLVAGCGGGGDAGAGTEQAASYVEGPVDGFGSIIVGGVRFDDSAAVVSGDDDEVRSAADIKLGMVVAIDGDGIDRVGARARARRIRFGAEIVGPVDSVDTAANTMVVLGQNVDVKDTTVFDEDIAGGLAGIAAGDVLAVNAQFDAATGRYVATRIDERPAADVFRLRGLVADLDTTAKTLRVGASLISYASVDPATLPLLLANGLRVRVRLQTTPVAGVWTALTVRPGFRTVQDMAQAEVHGWVTRFASPAHFAVNGLEVDASSASFPDGTAGLELGARVEVEGAIVNGVLVARKVELEDRRDDLERFELHGAIVSIDHGVKVFVLRGLRVSFDGPLQLECRATLAIGQLVEVRGFLSADRTRLVAVRIRCES